MIVALGEVKNFENIDTNIQIKTFLSEIRDFFHQMIRTVNINQNILNILDNISDFSYTWQSLDGYLNLFHRILQEDSSSLGLLRGMFFETVSILDIPLIRIVAIDSPSTVSVAEYYSTELIIFVK